MNLSPADFYVRLRQRMQSFFGAEDGHRHRWAEYLWLAPDLFHLLWKLSLDPRVPLRQKSYLGIALAYFISPMDLMPELLFGPGAYVDDIALTALVLHNILNGIDPRVVREHWAGQADILTVVQNILRSADRMVGTGLWGRIKRMI